MTNTPRTFKLTSPHMRGDDIRSWQSEVRAQFSSMDITCPIGVDGDYDAATRAFTASLCHALGIYANVAMVDGVTPELRSKIRNRDLTSNETARMNSQECIEYRRALRRRYLASAVTNVHRPVTKVIEHSWGYHPGQHDGVDVITPPDAVLFAMVKSKVIDVRPSGWWGLGAPKDPQLRSKGDGIIQLEILENVGPFRKGYHVGYGHAEKSTVTVGQIVNAGDQIGRAGFANAWHIHLMYNDGSTDKGIGNRDPEPMLEYALQYG